METMLIQKEFYPIVNCMRKMMAFTMHSLHHRQPWKRTSIIQYMGAGTVAINELLCMKNAGTQIAMDFS